MFTYNKSHKIKFLSPNLYLQIKQSTATFEVLKQSNSCAVILIFSPKKNLKIMNKIMLLVLLSTILWLSACEKDSVQTNLTEQTLIEESLENTEDLSLRNTNYMSMERLREQLEYVAIDESSVISAAWTHEDNIGFITGVKYTVINRKTGEMIKGFLEDADNRRFWVNAPQLEARQPLNPNNGITASWTFGNILGITSGEAYWNTVISELNNPDVWRPDGPANSGYLKDVPFWSNITDELTPKGITAGFLAPDNLFVAFSGSKIFVYSFDEGKWIISKEISELNDNEPFAFLKDVPLPQFKEINAAFYNEGAAEYVFMSELAWCSYSNKIQPWAIGSLSGNCFDAERAYQETQRESVCGILYSPVCGADGNTYNNRCRAKAAGIGCYKSGSCD